jgi:hypothetical protein
VYVIFQMQTLPSIEHVIRVRSLYDMHIWKQNHIIIITTTITIKLLLIKLEIHSPSQDLPISPHCSCSDVYLTSP